jgi:hypothetical protein
MIRDSIFDTELAEPAIGQVHLHSRQINSERIAKSRRDPVKLAAQPRICFCTNRKDSRNLHEPS